MRNSGQLGHPQNKLVWYHGTQFHLPFFALVKFHLYFKKKNNYWHQQISLCNCKLDIVSRKKKQKHNNWIFVKHKVLSQFLLKKNSQVNFNNNCKVPTAGLCSWIQLALISRRISLLCTYSSFRITHVAAGSSCIQQERNGHTEVRTYIQKHKCGAPITRILVRSGIF